MKKQAVIDWTVDVAEDQVDCTLQIDYDFYRCPLDEYPGHDYIEIDRFTLVGERPYLEEGGRLLEQGDIDNIVDDLNNDIDLNWRLLNE